MRSFSLEAASCTQLTPVTASRVGFTPPPFLDLQGFYVALRLVACAQSGHEVTLSNLSLNMPPPKFVSVRVLQVHALLISAVNPCFLSLFLIKAKFT